MNNRELATVILGGLVVVAIGLYATRNPGVRASLAGVLRAFLGPKVLGPILAFGGWVFGLIALSKKVGLWDDGLIFPAVLWTASAGLGLIFKLVSRKSGEPFFRPLIRRTFSLTLFVEAIVGLVAFSLGWELALLAFATFLGMLSAVAGTDEKLASVKNFIDGLVGLIGLAVIALTAINLIGNWGDLDKAHILRQLALPLWLTLGVIPYLYLLALWAGYEQAFIRINLSSDDRRARFRAKLALIAALHGRAAKANAFFGGWGRQMTEADGVVAAWRVGRAFLRDQQHRADEKREAAERLQRYAGVDGTDDEGRRLDQREFKETRDALLSLGTAQMGWHNQRGHYRDDLLDFFPFRQLPDDHGIQMRVAEDGQRWFAWRQTVTGWCFGIGAAGKPPDQWLYDGAQPPPGFPGSDRAWGDQFGLDMANW
jgi:hypothetical protein